MPKPVTVTYQVFPSAKEVSMATARLFASHVEQAVATRGIARVAISGGSTPKAMFDILADRTKPFADTVLCPSCGGVLDANSTLKKPPRAMKARCATP